MGTNLGVLQMRDGLLHAVNVLHRVGPLLRRRLENFELCGNMDGKSVPDADADENRNKYKSERTRAYVHGNIIHIRRDNFLDGQIIACPHV